MLGVGSKILNGSIVKVTDPTVRLVGTWNEIIINGSKPPRVYPLKTPATRKLTSQLSYMNTDTYDEKNAHILEVEQFPTHTLMMDDNRNHLPIATPTLQRPARHEWESPVVCFAHLGRKGWTIINLVMVRNGWNARVKLGYLWWHQVEYLTIFSLRIYLRCFLDVETVKETRRNKPSTLIPPQPKFLCKLWIGNNCWNTGKNQPGFPQIFPPKIVLYLVYPGFV